MAKVTLQSIADRVGVSRMTVSNAFSRPDQLSAELRSKILGAAEALGYSGPDPSARALARGRTGSVGLLLTDRLSLTIDDPVNGEFIAAVSDELADSDMALTLLAPRERDGAISSDIGMDGVMVYVCRTPTVELEWARRRGLPMVTVDQEPLADATSINVDDRRGGQLGAQHVVDLGHRRIGLLTIEDRRDEDGELSPTRARMAGWREVLESAGVEPLVAEGVYLFTEPTYDATRAMLDRPDRPTALLCLSDAFALEAIRAATDLGLRVPEDLSIVGYDDSRYARSSRPTLTTIRQDVSAKGHIAAAALIRAIRGGAPAEPERVLLPAELVVRDSTGPAPKG